MIFFRFFLSRLHKWWHAQNSISAKWSSEARLSMAFPVVEKRLIPKVWGKDLFCFKCIFGSIHHTSSSPKKEGTIIPSIQEWGQKMWRWKCALDSEWLDDENPTFLTKEFDFLSGASTSSVITEPVRKESLLCLHVRKNTRIEWVGMKGKAGARSADTEEDKWWLKTWEMQNLINALPLP